MDQLDVAAVTDSEIAIMRKIDVVVREPVWLTWGWESFPVVGIFGAEAVPGGWSRLG